MAKVDSTASGDLLGDQLRNSPHRRLASGSVIDKVFAGFVPQDFVVEEMEIIMGQGSFLRFRRKYARLRALVPRECNRAFKSD